MLSGTELEAHGHINRAHGEWPSDIRWRRAKVFTRLPSAGSKDVVLRGGFRHIHGNGCTCLRKAYVGREAGSPRKEGVAGS